MLKLSVTGDADTTIHRSFRASNLEKDPGTFWHRLHKWATNNLSRYRCLAPYLVFLVYIFAGSGILYVIEIYCQTTYNFRRSPRLMDCIAGHSYWAAVFYVTAATSTIGFGNVYPCTELGRAISTFYSIFGIPLVVYILDNMGKHLFVGMRALHGKWRSKNLCYDRRPRRQISVMMELQYLGTDHIEKRCAQKELCQKAKDPPKSHDRIETLDESLGTENDEETEVEIPMKVGVVALVGCVGMISMYQFFYEEYDLKDSLYYSVMTFLGGDFVTQRFFWVVPVYLVIFVGFSMLSLTITICQDRIAKFMERFKKNLMKKVNQQIQENLSMGESPRKINVDDVVKRSFNSTTGPSWLKFMVSEKELTSLKDVVTKAVSKDETGVQAGLSNHKRLISTRHIGSQWHDGLLKDSGAQTNEEVDALVQSCHAKLEDASQQTEPSDTNHLTVHATPNRNVKSTQSAPESDAKALTARVQCRDGAIVTHGHLCEAEVQTEVDARDVGSAANLGNYPRSRDSTPVIQRKKAVG